MSCDTNNLSCEGDGLPYGTSELSCEGDNLSYGMSELSCEGNGLSCEADDSSCEDDPFYSDENIKHLEEMVALDKAGLLKWEKHDLCPSGQDF